MNRTCLLLVSLLNLMAMRSASAADGVTPPRVLDPNWKIELMASEPELVTPTACRFDGKGGLFVVECHTHFPPEDYQGPQSDRIYRYEDSDGDGVVDRRHLFHQGGEATMGIAPLRDGWLAVATRSELYRIRDGSGDHTADERETLLTMNTKTTYPHDGLTGLAVGPDGWIYIGQGENLGETYELLAADGSKQVGGGEGGNLFRCTAGGQRLQRVATGLWNPFGLRFDAAGRLWAVGNDPDAMPPCRLIRVLPAGDYGFQFRFGRAGTHPLQSWNGEYPGTLPMVAGTGEAPCDVMGVGDQLWVTSWGDNRIERYRLQVGSDSGGPHWTSQTEVVVQGDARFRPVSMTRAPDGSIYVTDWVDRSYPVHGKGRLWRLSRVEGSPPITEQLPELSEQESNARALLQSEVSAADRLDALGSANPMLRQFALQALIQHDQLHRLDADQLETPQQRLGLLMAWRWKQFIDPESVSRDRVTQWIDRGLRDDSEAVVLAALRWATEQSMKEQLPVIQSLLQRQDLTPRMFSAVIAATAYLETGSAASGRTDPAQVKRLAEFVGRTGLSARVRALAVEQIDAASETPTNQQLTGWLEVEKDRAFGIAVVRLLAARGGDALDDLATIANDPSQDLQTRADAIAALARSAGKYAVVLNKLSLPRQPEILRREARRATRRTWRDRQNRPSNNDLSAWDQLLSEGGDRDAGRRVFFRTTCANCHAHSGRGAATGPDLTEIAGQMSRLRLIESILHPSKEIGPLYVPWRLITVDGRVLTGLKLSAAGVGNRLRFQGADGLEFEVPLDEIERQDTVKQSIMPAGLADSLSIDELRDLIAFLMAEKE